MDSEDYEKIRVKFENKAIYELKEVLYLIKEILEKLNEINYPDLSIAEYVLYYLMKLLMIVTSGLKDESVSSQSFKPLECKLK